MALATLSPTPDLDYRRITDYWWWAPWSKKIVHTFVMSIVLLTFGSKTCHDSWHKTFGGALRIGNGHVDTRHQDATSCSVLISECLAYFVFVTLILAVLGILDITFGAYFIAQVRCDSSVAIPIRFCKKVFCIVVSRTFVVILISSKQEKIICTSSNGTSCWEFLRQ